MADYRSFLRMVPMFSRLPEEEMVQLCASVKEVRLAAGDVLFTEGNIEHEAYVILDGKIEVYKNTTGRPVQLAVRLPGEVVGELALLQNAPRSASGRALEDSRVLAIDQDQFNTLVDTNPNLARSMLHTVTQRLRTTELLLQQNERLAHLGMFSAGLAHELNNPAAAVLRGAEQLGDAFGRFQNLERQLGALDLTATQISTLRILSLRVQESQGQPPERNALDSVDREERLETWLVDQGIEDAWDAIPALSDLRIEPDELDELFAGFTPTAISTTILWLGTAHTLYSLLREIGMGASRMSEIVRALKSYVYLDQAPVQDVDLHEGLENTLVILRHKIKGGLTVQRDYDPNLPKIQAYGSELNQVWTNLIDNAIDALEGNGQITLRTRREGEWVIAAVEDNGPGIPEEIQSRLFSPFFTTKSPGKGTGLGLNITYNIVHKHGGDIKVHSRPGQTIFEVFLPLDFDKPVGTGPQPVPDEKEGGAVL